MNNAQKQRYPEIRFAEQRKIRKGQGIFLIALFGGMSIGMLSLGIAVGMIGLIIFAVATLSLFIFAGTWLIMGKSMDENEWLFISRDTANTMFPVNPIQGNKWQIILYLKFQSVYYKLVGDYIVKNTKLKEYDKQIAHYPCVPYVKMDIYQLLAQNHLDYFYLRNALSLWSLTGEELQYLQRRYLSGNYELSAKDENFIKNTLPKAIKIDSTDGERNCNVYYGMENEYYALPNDALVIGLRVDLGNNENKTELQHKELSDVMAAAENDIAKCLGIKTFVVQYIDNAVISAYTRGTGGGYYRTSALYEK